MDTTDAEKDEDFQDTIEAADLCPNYDPKVWCCSLFGMIFHSSSWACQHLGKGTSGRIGKESQLESEWH